MVSGGILGELHVSHRGQSGSTDHEHQTSWSESKYSTAAAAAAWPWLVSAVTNCPTWWHSGGPRGQLGRGTCHQHMTEDYTQAGVFTIICFPLLTETHPRRLSLPLSVSLILHTISREPRKAASIAMATEKPLKLRFFLMLGEASGAAALACVHDHLWESNCFYIHRQKPIWENLRTFHECKSM